MTNVVAINDLPFYQGISGNICGACVCIKFKSDNTVWEFFLKIVHPSFTIRAFCKSFHHWHLRFKFRDFKSCYYWVFVYGPPYGGEPLKSHIILYLLKSIVGSLEVCYFTFVCLTTNYCNNKNKLKRKIYRFYCFRWFCTDISLTIYFSFLAV